MYETYKPGQLNSHHRAGGCNKCLLSSMSREDRAYYENMFASEGVGHESDGKTWEDHVDDNCIHDIVVTGEASYLY